MSLQGVREGDEAGEAKVKGVLERERQRWKREEWTIEWEGEIGGMEWYGE